MNLKIAIASGKGGTGKTTVALNLFRWFGENGNYTVQLVDCDVEEPNDVLFFRDVVACSNVSVNQPVPVIDMSQCSFCRRCAEYCEFNAIVVIPPIQFAEVNESLCHSCGACVEACQFRAIREKPIKIGEISKYDLSPKKKLIEGRLKIGSAKQTMLINSLKKGIDEEYDISLFDAPPGTSCPVVQTISSSDFVVVVTEPTPFGLHDLKLMTELLNNMNLDYGVVVNKAGVGNNDVYQYLKDSGILLLGSIPFSQDYVSLYAGGNIFSKIPNDIDKSYHQIVARIIKTFTAYEGDNNCKW